MAAVKHKGSRQSKEDHKSLSSPSSTSLVDSEEEEDKEDEVGPEDEGGKGVRKTPKFSYSSGVCVGRIQRSQQR